MRRGRVFLYLAFILILGVVAVAVIWMRFLQPQGQPAEEVSPTPVVDLVNVVVVTQRVPRGNVLDESVLSMIPIQRDLMIEGYFIDLAEVVGRRAKVDLAPNMLLTTGLVVDTTEQLSEVGSNAALSIPKGMVAISIPISRLSSVSYALKPGDHVNIIVAMAFIDLDTDFQTRLPNLSAAVIGAGPGVVIGSSTGDTVQSAAGTDGKTATSSTQIMEELLKLTAQNVSGGPASVIGRMEVSSSLGETYYVIPSEPQRFRMVSQMLLQNAIVLRVGNFDLAEEKEIAAVEAEAEAEATPTPVAPARQVQTAEPTPIPAPPPPDVITLIVTPQDAVTINYLIFSGAQLTLVLRSAGDDTTVPTEAATLDYILKQYNIPVPVKLPYGAEPRIDALTPPTLKNDIQPTPVP